MLLGDADVEAAVGELLLELVEAGARRHRRGDRNHLVVPLRLGDQRLGEDAGIGRRARLGLGLGAGDDVELLDAVIFVRRRLGRAVALALLGDDMDEHRPFGGVADILEYLDQPLDIVAVDRADIIEAELLEERAAGPEAARIFLPAPRHDVEAPGQLARDLLGDAPQRQIFARRDQPREIVGEPADRRRDRHVVVVEDDDQPVAGGPGVVHRLIGHARRHRAVADHRDRLAGLVRKLVRHREAKRRRDRGRAVRRAERIVFALGAPGEAGKAAAHAQGADAVAPAGDDLVRIALVADVPDQPVAGRIEHIMERHRQLDHAKARRRDGRRSPRPPRSSRRAIRRRAGGAAPCRSLRMSAGVSTVSSKGRCGTIAHGGACKPVGRGCRMLIRCRRAAGMAGRRTVILIPWALERFGKFSPQDI